MTLSAENSAQPRHDIPIIEYLPSKQRRPKQKQRHDRSSVSKPDYQTVAIDRFQKISQLEIKVIGHSEKSQSSCNCEPNSAESLSTPNKPAPASSSSKNSLPISLLRICETPLLEKEEEQLLFQKYNCHKAKAVELRENISPESPSQELMDLVENHLTLAEEYRDRILTANMRLVVSVVKKFLDQDHTLDDLVSEGSMSLVRAIDNFDYSRGFRFSTYATYAIRRNFYRYVINARKKKQKVTPTAPETFSEISDQRPEIMQNPDTMFHLQQNLLKMIQELNEREQEVIIARFGISKKEDHQTLQSIADRLGVCKERIRQLEKKALHKLRKLSKKYELDQFDFV